MNDDTIEGLRSTLFQTMRALSDKDNPMDIERAKAISEVAQTIINSAKVEVDHARITGGSATGFLGGPAAKPNNNTATGTKTVTMVPGATVTQHKLRG